MRLTAALDPVQQCTPYSICHPPVTFQPRIEAAFAALLKCCISSALGEASRQAMPTHHERRSLRLIIVEQQLACLSAQANALQLATIILCVGAMMLDGAWWRGTRQGGTR